MLCSVISGLWIPGLEPLHSVKYNRFMYFTFITKRSKQQGASALLTRLQVFISEGKVRTIFILYQFQELRTRNLLGPAPALCWGRATGVIWESSYFPPFQPTRAGLNSSRLVKIPSCSTRVSMTGVSRMQKEWYNLEASKKNKKITNFVFQKKKFTMSPGPHLLISNGGPNS